MLPDGCPRPVVVAALWWWPVVRLFGRWRRNGAALAAVVVPRLRRLWRTGSESDARPPWLLAALAAVGIGSVVAWVSPRPLGARSVMVGCPVVPVVGPLVAGVGLVVVAVVAWTGGGYPSCFRRRTAGSLSPPVAGVVGSALVNAAMVRSVVAPASLAGCRRPTSFQTGPPVVFARPALASCRRLLID